MVLVIFRVQLGGWRGTRDQHRWREFIFRIRSGSFIRRSRSILGFPTMATSTRSWGLRLTAGLPFSKSCARLLICSPDGGFRLNLDFFRHHREDDVPYQWTEGSPEFRDLFSSELEQLLGPRRLPTEPLEDRHRDIAHSVQAMYEEAFFHLLCDVAKAFGTDRLGAGRWLCDELGRQR